MVGSFPLKSERSSRRPLERISLGRVPAPEFILKSSKGQQIEKLCGHSEWQPRSIYVTAERLLIAHHDHDDEIADQIPLVNFFVFAFISRMHVTKLQISMKLRLPTAGMTALVNSIFGL